MRSISFLPESSSDVGSLFCDDSFCSTEYISECEYLPPDESFSDVLYAQKKNEWLIDLFDLPIKYGEEGWDGYDAAPLLPDSFVAAISFFNRYMKAFPLPKVMVDPNGYVCLKWVRSRTERLELTFPRQGVLYAVSVVKGERLVSAISTCSQIMERSRAVLEWKD